MIKPKEWRTAARPDMLAVEDPMQLGTLITSADTNVKAVSAPDSLSSIATLYFQEGTKGCCRSAS